MAMRSLAEIDEDLAAARAARRSVLTRGQAEGADGASRQRASLKDIVESIKDLERERNLAAGTGGMSFTPTIGSGS